MNCEQFIDLHQVAKRYENRACYESAMARVEVKRDEMLAELVLWSGRTLDAVVQFIGSLTFGGAAGRTFDEQLEATHGYAHIEWIHREDQAA